MRILLVHASSLDRARRSARRKVLGGRPPEPFGGTAGYFCKGEPRVASPRSARFARFADRDAVAPVALLEGEHP